MTQQSLENEMFSELTTHVCRVRILFVSDVWGSIQVTLFQVVFGYAKLQLLRSDSYIVPDSQQDSGSKHCNYTIQHGSSLVSVQRPTENHTVWNEMQIQHAQQGLAKRCMETIAGHIWQLL